MADFSVALSNALEEKKLAMPKAFNSARFVAGAMSLLNNTDTLKEYFKKYPNVAGSNIKLGLIKGALLNLEPLDNQFYLIPYGENINFMVSYKGAIALAKKYCTRPIKSIYSEMVYEGEQFSIEIDGENRKVHHVQNPFKKTTPIGVYAVCEFMDGGCQTETMTMDEVETVKRQSKSSGSLPWKSFYGEMCRKAVIKRLCKHLPISFESVEQQEEYNNDMAIETDPKNVVRNEIENAEVVDFE